jgi:hypothetical protein
MSNIKKALYAVATIAFLWRDGGLRRGYQSALAVGREKLRTSGKLSVCDLIGIIMAKEN